MTTSPLDRITDLAGWLGAAGIDELHLAGPDGHVRLRRAGSSAPAWGFTEPARASVTGAVPEPSHEPIISPGVGHFLHAHPLHDEPLASPDEAVTKGQLVGLLRIGPLLAPVTAPRDGIVAEIVVAEGTLVGYGDTVAVLWPAS